MWLYRQFTICCGFKVTRRVTHLGSYMCIVMESVE